jgi:hypothetical protein
MRSSFTAQHQTSDITNNSLRGCCTAAVLPQVPFNWFLPLMATEVATHAYGSIVFDLQPRYWFAVRYLTGMVIAIAVCALHNVLGRKQFCNSLRGSSGCKAKTS